MRLENLTRVEGFNLVLDPSRSLHFCLSRLLYYFAALQMRDLCCCLWVLWMVQPTGSMPCYYFNNAVGLCSVLLVSMASAPFDGKFRNNFMQLGCQWLFSARLQLFSSNLLLVSVSERFYGSLCMVGVCFFAVC